MAIQQAVALVAALAVAFTAWSLARADSVWWLAAPLAAAIVALQHRVQLPHLAP